METLCERKEEEVAARGGSYTAAAANPEKSGGQLDLRLVIHRFTTSRARSAMPTRPERLARAPSRQPSVEENEEALNVTYRFKVETLYLIFLHF